MGAAPFLMDRFLADTQRPACFTVPGPRRAGMTGTLPVSPHPRATGRR